MEKVLDNFLKPLELIEKVESPPFLLTRIQQKIKLQTANTIQPKIVWACSVSLALIVLLNVLVITRNHTTNEHERNLVETFQLMPDNNFYR